MRAVQEKHSQDGSEPLVRRELPPLNSGDRLSRAEFERRYANRTDIKKAELIEGVVYVAPPVRVKQHGRPHSHVVTWLGMYKAHTPGVDMADNATLQLDLENEPQPDALLWIDEKRGGQARVTDDDYLAGAPELIVEVAASSAAYDLHDKLRAYRRNGVREYLVLLAYDQQSIWYVLNEGEYQPMTADGRGIVRSRAFPGLWFNSELFWRNDLAGLLMVLQEGLNSPEHKEFVTDLEG